MSPEIPDSKPVIANAMKIIIAALMPDNLLALLFMPTASTNVPKAVRLVNHAMNATTIIVMIMGTGSHKKLPCPMNLKGV